MLLSRWIIVLLCFVSACHKTDTDSKLGTKNAHCYSNHTCAEGLRCDADDICKVCSIGSEACTCGSGQQCDSGLECHDGLCLDASAQTALTTCFTPCRTSFTRTDGSWAQCSAEGLVEGCLDNATCVQGTCTSIPVSEQSSALAAASCMADIDCPEHQACSSGQCSSNCNTSVECGAGRVCSRHVCRLGCNTSDAPCAVGSHCSLTDGETGVCMTTAAPEVVPQRTVLGTFDVSTTHLKFSPFDRVLSITITNNSPRSQNFKISKVEHTVENDRVKTVVRFQPLSWLRTSIGGIESNAQERTLQVAANGGQVVVTLDNISILMPKTWWGVVKISSEELGERRIDLAGVSLPEGQWHGEMTYFSNFPTGGLEDWLAAKNAHMSPSIIEQRRGLIRNALIRRFHEFRYTNNLDGIEEWNAVLQATQGESWKVPILRQKCPSPTEACYLYNNDFGFSQYTNDTNAWPIPTGATSMPIVMNMRAIDTGVSQQLLGKIESSATLQYPGSPAVSLSFSSEPSNCTGQTRTCLIDLADFSATAYVGARFFPAATDTACERGERVGNVNVFDMVKTPWLIPGFTHGTVSELGQRYQRECRDRTLPLGNKSTLYAENRSLAAVNPIPDSRTRARTLALVDGALINQDTLFILFKESFGDFLSDDASDQFVSYGYMVLKRGDIDLADDSLFDGAVTAPPAAYVENDLGVTCDSSLVARALGRAGTVDVKSLDSTDLTALATELVTGTRIGSLDAIVAEAFAYRLQFSDRDGKSIGFTPDLCGAPGAGDYCYDSAVIEDLEDRQDCAVYLFGNVPSTRATLVGNLWKNFSYNSYTDQYGDVIVDYGFEHLNAELLVMLGDDAYTSAVSSRFDLAQNQINVFEGQKFEINGIKLSGAVGHEMVELYKAVQYYQKALDRFYRMSPIVWESLAESSISDLIDAKSADSYLARLVRASTQKARLWSEIARRYHRLDRSDLAHRVSERAYGAIYMESIAMARVLGAVRNINDLAARAQLVAQLEQVQQVYNAAMSEIRQVHIETNEEINAFGFASDYVPFPAIDGSDTDGFRVVLAVAKQHLEAARAKEEKALSSARSFDVDATSFASELVTIQNNYENQLADICGTFKGDDGQVHPRIKKYTGVNAELAAQAEPCGVSNGRLFSAAQEIEAARVKLEQTRQAADNIRQEVEIERQRVTKVCDLYDELADYEYEQNGKVNKLSSEMDDLQRTNQLTQDLASAAATAFSSGSWWGGGAIATGIQAVAAAAQYAFQGQINDKKEKIANIQNKLGRWKTKKQCDFAMADSDAKTASLFLQLSLANYDVMSAAISLTTSVANGVALYNQATALLAQYAEAEQNAIDATAARNDPNVRIYRNDAVIAAERTFNTAIREAYRATRMYEYYTSQSYGNRGDLAYIRMVGYGDVTLESYLADLEDAFLSFEESFGNPDTRVAIISVRDDVLSIPRIDDNGKTLSSGDRIYLLREKLADAAYLSDAGYLTLPFSSKFEILSPLTRNHKIHHIEAEIIGSDIGDTLGRIYLAQSGTSTVHAVDDSYAYYLFPERTAVINPFFNGVRALSGEVYRSERMRDRPFINTAWNLVINQRDESVNQDINIQSLTDIRLYVYYTDFTEL